MTQEIRDKQYIKTLETSRDFWQKKHTDSWNDYRNAVAREQVLQDQFLRVCKQRDDRDWQIKKLQEQIISLQAKVIKLQEEKEQAELQAEADRSYADFIIEG